MKASAVNWCWWSPVWQRRSSWATLVSDSPLNPSFPCKTLTLFRASFQNIRFANDTLQKHKNTDLWIANPPLDRHLYFSWASAANVSFQNQNSKCCLFEQTLHWLARWNVYPISDGLLLTSVLVLLLYRLGLLLCDGVVSNAFSTVQWQRAQSAVFIKLFFWSNVLYFTSNSSFFSEDNCLQCLACICNYVTLTLQTE